MSRAVIPQMRVHFGGGAARGKMRLMDAITTVPAPVNEPNLTYAPGSTERLELEQRRQYDRCIA